MSVCRDCAFWQYSFPHVAGVCTVGPRELLGGGRPLTRDLVGDFLFDQHEECSTATFATSVCAEWEQAEEGAEDIPYIDEDGKPQSFFDEGDEDASECL